MWEDAGGWTYILASARNGTLYTGSARDLVKRIHEHREGVFHGFTRKYGVTLLVWFERHDSVAMAYKREQLIKRWRRAWKLALVEQLNPQWRDLWPGLSSNLPSPLPGRSPGFEPGCDPGSKGS